MRKITIPHTLSGLLVHMLGDALGLRPAGTGEGGAEGQAPRRRGGHPVRSLREYLVIVVMAMSLFALTYGFIKSWAETGPGCPADPTWLGWCEDIQ